MHADLLSIGPFETNFIQVSLKKIVFENVRHFIQASMC